MLNSLLAPSTLTIELPQWFPLVGTAIALAALFIAFANFRRKSGLKVRGNYVLASSIDCRYHYVAQVMLENLKDRPITIFAVYLRVGFNNYIQLESFGDRPLILKSYETHQQDFGPVQFYASNLRKLDLENILINRKIKKRLVISTGDGKYVVPKPIMAWHPIATAFKNAMTTVITPMTLMHRDKYIGSRVKFVIDIRNGTDLETVMLSENSHEYSVFKNFRLTKDSLQTVDSLSTFLNEKLASQGIDAGSFKIYDISPRRKEMEDEYKETVDAIPVGWFKYFVVGRLAAWLFNLQINWRIRSALRKK